MRNRVDVLVQEIESLETFRARIHRIRGIRVDRFRNSFHVMLPLENDLLWRRGGPKLMKRRRATKGGVQRSIVGDL